MLLPFLRPILNDMVSTVYMLQEIGGPEDVLEHGGHSNSGEAASMLPASVVSRGHSPAPASSTDADGESPLDSAPLSLPTDGEPLGVCAISTELTSAVYVRTGTVAFSSDGCSLLQVDVQQELRYMAGTGHGGEAAAGPSRPLDSEHATHSSHFFSHMNTRLPYPSSLPEAHESMDCGQLGSYRTATGHHWYGDQSDPYVEWTEGLEV
jgi:hypothetical protein